MLVNDRFAISPIAFGNLTVSGAFATAAVSVDIGSSFLITQTTAGIDYLIPAPTNPVVGQRVSFTAAAASVYFTVLNRGVRPGDTVEFAWSGAVWRSVDDTGIFRGSRPHNVALNGITGLFSATSTTGQHTYLVSINSGIAQSRTYLISANNNDFAGPRSLSPISQGVLQTVNDYELLYNVAGAQLVVSMRRLRGATAGNFTFTAINLGDLGATFSHNYGIGTDAAVYQKQGSTLQSQVIIANLAANQVTAAGNVTVTNAWTAQVNTISGLNLPANGRWTAPESGLYRIQFTARSTVRPGSAASQSVATIRQNGTLDYSTGNYTIQDLTGQMVQTIEETIYANAGDTFDFLRNIGLAIEFAAPTAALAGTRLVIQRVA